MSLYPILLFLHVLGAICFFSSIGILLFGTLAIRWATTVEQVRAILRPLIAGRTVGFEHVSVIDLVAIVGVLVTGTTGLYMGLTVWGWPRGWVQVAIVSFALMAPVGPAVINPRLHAIAKAAMQAPDGPIPESLYGRIHDLVLGTGLQVLIAWLVGIVFLMTNKPSLGGSALAILVALAIGLASGVLLRRGAPQVRSPNSR